MLQFYSTVRLEMNTNGQKINTQILSLKIIITALTEAYVLGKKRSPQLLQEASHSPQRNC